MTSTRCLQPRNQLYRLFVGATGHNPTLYMRCSSRFARLQPGSSRRSPYRLSLARRVSTATLQALNGNQPAPRFDDRALAQMQEQVHTLLQSPTVPSQDSIEGALADCEIFARALYDSPEEVGIPTKNQNTPASTLLDLERNKQVQSIGLTKPVRDQVVERLSALAYSIVTDPKTFINVAALASYVATQCFLGRPESLPQVFVLYAHKPVHRPGSSPPQFKAPNPSKASSAIPLVLAHAALTSAMEIKSLPLCFDIINTSVCAPAFKRNKFIRRALLPCTALALAPLAAFVLASQLSVYQDGLERTTARNMIFAGTLAYVGFTTTIGYVALTTRNDQMNRITWTIGLPLRERWLREEERAFTDRVAQAWGFQENLRRGEEEGQDWEALREWAGLRGMVLDKVSLMEGME